MSSRDNFSLSDSQHSSFQQSGSKMGCCVTFSRVIVFLMNLAMLLVALTVIALALWIRLDNNFEHDLRRDIKYDGDEEPLRDIKRDMRTGITVVFWVIIGFAIACAILGLTGLLGAAANSRFLLVPYFVAMVFLILLEIAVGIAVLVKRKDVRRTVKDYVYWSYNLNTIDVQAFNFRYNCCGVEGYPNPQCFQNAPTCSSAVWDRLDFTMMVFGICMLGVIVLQIITTLISVFVFTYRRKEDGPLMIPVQEQ
ncbi:hypothetical protein WR25_07674 [Diploscapter pachys]|uniref:Tetraspanin n=1 Tax=Diploscapter pachys TaxID=2018661 RepID=A0A2A2JPA7_9BILA|nr:hypothetical protein WR25_07674 [Diploscapter pachys]